MLLTFLFFWFLFMGIRISFRIVSYTGRVLLTIIGIAILLPVIILFGFGLFGLALVGLMVPLLLVSRLH